MTHAAIDKIFVAMRFYSEDNISLSIHNSDKLYKEDKQFKQILSPSNFHIWQ